ncbi:MerR family transcriptional regulator [Streptomyces alkaliphilus]|uniref:MerR family transcriptional regulator n=1 Tax=Streptomyces alkaliphilus TaxID=1472722 RepID=UPI001181714E|nr:MerR family transcriptional regulator [Streptomyces alkaliphilus]MQS08008.1 MerR family transcriptional regulator [Streptomyces alkaliphilus]
MTDERPARPETGPAGDTAQTGHEAVSRTGAGGEYRTAELAEAAGITVRTLRFYRERGLLPPPRREGRLAWYDDHHLARLRTIAALLARGHTLNGIAELIDAFTRGRGTGTTAELLGMADHPWPPAEEEPVRLAPEDLAARFEAGDHPGEDIAANLATAMEIGYVVADGDDLVHVSRTLLEASSALVRAGLPLSSVLATGRRVRGHAEDLAESFTELLRAHLLGDVLDREAEGPLSEADLKEVSGVVEHLRPIAKQVVYAEVSLALDRRLRAEVEGRRRAADATGPAPDPAEPSGRPAAGDGDRDTPGSDAGSRAGG